jgi:hypothetical protein
MGLMVLVLQKLEVSNATAVTYFSPLLAFAMVSPLITFVSSSP